MFTTTFIIIELIVIALTISSVYVSEKRIKGVELP